MNNTEKKELKRLQKSKLKAQAGGNLKEEAELCNFIGELLARSGDYHAAIKEHRQELQLSESLQDIIGAAVANRKIGECFNELGEYPKALKHQHKHLQLAESVDNVLEQQRALATIGRTYLCWADSLEVESVERTESLQEAQKAFLRSLSLCEGSLLPKKISERERMEMRARLLLNLGLVHESLGSCKNSVNFIQKAIFIAEKHSLLEDLFRCHLSLGDVFQRSGVISKAGRSMESALLVAKKMKSKELESQCLCASANVFFQLGDFPAAKRSLKKAYKLGGQQAGERENLIKALKTAIRCVSLQSQLESVGSADAALQLPILEALGDLCCKVDSYKRAVDFYQKQLQCAKTLAKPAKELASIYVSLAATYADDRQYQRAIDMYSQELTLRKGNFKEETRTWLNVADMQEKAGEGFEVVQKSYATALECAKQADHPRLQITALRGQLLLLEKHNVDHLLRPTQKMLRALREEHDIGSDDSQDISDEDDEEEGDEGKSSDLLSESLETPLNELSDSDSGSDEEYDRPSATDRIRRQKFSKLNEKGESLLHRACIAGNLKQVKKLVEQGHPLNPRDYCGWTPLHEACNYGYIDIVKALVDAGADINDRGGDMCDGLTPLHDAVNCGNWVVARLLIENGANRKAKDAAGHTPLDALKAWLESYTSEIDQETREECFEVARLLREGVSLGDMQPSHKAPVKQAQTKAFLMDSELFECEEESQGSQRQSQRTLGEPLPHRTQRGAAKTHDSLGRRRSEGGAPRNVGVASRRNAALSLGSDSNDESDGRDDVELMSLDDQFRAGNHSNYRRRASDEDSLPDVEIGARASSQTSSPSRGSQPTGGDDNRAMSPVSLPDSQGVPQDQGDSDDDGGDGMPSTYLSHTDLRTDVDCPSTARQSYRDAMKALGSASTLASEIPAGVSSGLRPDETKSALIPEASYTGGDDWLVDDVQPQPRKRQRVDIEGAFRDATSHRSQFEPPLGPSISGDNKTRTSSRSLSRKSRPKQARLTSLGVTVQHMPTRRPSLADEQAINEGEDSEESDFIREQSSTQTNRRRSSESVGQSELSCRVSPSTQAEQRPLLPGPSTMMRVQVQIQDKLLLIPVSLRDRPSMQWLADQAASRYYSQCGLRPKLSLSTPEGALFSPEDSVVDLLNNNEKVMGRVESWDLPPITERYKQACDRAKMSHSADILARLQACHAQQPQLHSTLDLAHLYLRPAPLAPLLSALQCQYSLRILHLHGNRLDDTNAPQLASALGSLPNLTGLDLSRNDLTAEGLRAVADVLERGDGRGDGSSGSKPLQLLEELDLSYNCLTDSCALSIATLVKHCPLLRTLSARSCDLTAKFFQLHRHRLVDSFKGAESLHSLHLSHNPLGSTGVELLLGCLSPGVLTHLDLSCVMVSRADSIHLARHLAKYFTEEPVLDNLQLSGCHLADVDVDYLKSLHPSTKQWKHLDLSANPRLTSSGLANLLVSLHQASIPVARLDLSGCDISSPLDSSLLDAFTTLLPDPSSGAGLAGRGCHGEGEESAGGGLVELRLCGTGLNKVDKELLMNVWNVAHWTQAGHHIDVMRCWFFVTDQ